MLEVSPKVQFFYKFIIFYFELVSSLCMRLEANFSDFFFKELESVRKILNSEFIYNVHYTRNIRLVYDLPE